MVEHRSPKPRVACSSRVSPATRRSKVRFAPFLFYKNSARFLAPPYPHKACRLCGAPTATQLGEKPSVFLQFTGFVRFALFRASLETAQNRNVWASRAKARFAHELS